MVFYSSSSHVYKLKQKDEIEKKMKKLCLKITMVKLNLLQKDI